jgi:hypothetical protein
MIAAFCWEHIPVEVSGIGVSLCGPYAFSNYPKGDRVFLVLTIINKRKMCFLVTEDRVLLCSLQILERNVYTKKTVVGGFLSGDRLVLVDMYHYKGVNCNNVSYSLRQLMISVFLHLDFGPRTNDAISISHVQRFETMAEAIASNNPYLMHPIYESFEVQNNKHSFLECCPMRS